jgi:hypothetical protein
MSKVSQDRFAKTGRSPSMKSSMLKKTAKKRMLFSLGAQVDQLLCLGASQEEVSKSEFIRQAIREKAGRVLTGVGAHLTNETGSVIAHGGPAKKLTVQE